MDTIAIIFLSEYSTSGRVYIDNIVFLPEDTFIPPETITMIDNYNDEVVGKNTLGCWTGGGGTDGWDMKEKPLHIYLYDLYDVGVYRTNNMRRFEYYGSGWYAATLEQNKDTDRRDISEYTHLSFRIKKENGNDECVVKIEYGPPGAPVISTNVVPVSSYCAVTREWQQVNIPLSAFTGLDETRVWAIVFVFDGYTGAIQLDNLEFSMGYGKPESTGQVKIDRTAKQLLVFNSGLGAYELFQVKGVGYQPVPIGGEAPIITTDAATLELILDRDLPLIRDMGCNTIRTWGGWRNWSGWNGPEEPGVMLLKKAKEYGLKVILGYWMPIHVNFGDPTVRSGRKNDFIDFIDTYKDAPISDTLLVWAIGNENNYHNGSGEDYYNLCNELAEIAYQAEGASYHPVIIVNGNLTKIGVDERSAEDLQLNYIDAWGTNVYFEDFDSILWFTDNPLDARPFFGIYKEKSCKPLIITEYGSDAYDNNAGQVDENAQASWVSTNVLDIIMGGAADSDICAGACIMEYSDEWWKYKSGDDNIQETGGFPMPGMLPDDYANEEYWGVMEIIRESDATPDWYDYSWNKPNDGLDEIRPREVYNTLKAIYNPVGFSADPVVGPKPLTVNFKGQSGSAILSWLWSFGDSGTSIEQNPTHEYLNAGIYTVTLTVTTNFGVFEETKEDYISVSSSVRDSEEIQRKIDLARRGSVVEIDPGTYVFTSDLNITENLALVGEDPNTTVFDLGGHHILIKDPNHKYSPLTPFSKNLTNVTIDGITITGHDGTSANGPIQNYARELTLKNCKIIGNRGIKASAIYTSYMSHLYLDNVLMARNINISADSTSPYGRYWDFTAHCATIYLCGRATLNVEKTTIADNINASRPIAIQTSSGLREVKVDYGTIHRSWLNRVNIIDSIIWDNGKET
ncbi:MAG: PKD domain-containing protein, partial [Candidatus Marinimicrobia bacterium]|nr:PKD domain-containing protein [Candidatus Neomarinimicrobiota bacterium]